MRYYDAVDFVVFELTKKTYPSIFESRSALKTYLTKEKGEIPDDILLVINAILRYERSTTDIVDHRKLKRNMLNISLWKGDITLLKVGAIVNAANKYGLGCFKPFHKCVDNTIHNKAGPLLRHECNQVMEKRGDLLKTGEVFITKAYVLPCDNIIHALGPVYENEIDPEQKLKDCYINSLNLAKEKKIKSIAFTCISTGMFGFPREGAARIAVQTVNEWIRENPCYDIHVIFCTYRDNDYDVYKEKLLRKGRR